MLKDGLMNVQKDLEELGKSVEPVQLVLTKVSKLFNT